MPLFLTPALTDMSRDEIEAHREAVRSRRMLAAIEYHEGKNAKFEHESILIQRRIAQQYNMLEKEIFRLDKADEAVGKRLNIIETMKATLGLTLDMIQNIEDKQNG